MRWLPPIFKSRLVGTMLRFVFNSRKQIIEVSGSQVSVFKSIFHSHLQFLLQPLPPLRNHRLPCTPSLNSILQDANYAASQLWTMNKYLELILHVSTTYFPRRTSTMTVNLRKEYPLLMLRFISFTSVLFLSFLPSCFCILFKLLPDSYNHFQCFASPASQIPKATRHSNASVIWSWFCLSLHHA